MEIAAAIIATVLLTVAAIAISRAGGDPEDLNDHDPVPASEHAHGRPPPPKTDRPAGPDAEPMGVAGPGEPSIAPDLERKGERIVGETRRH